ncbi:MAG: GtrA-like protein [uncultured bacterium]|uniref:GtrA/DPMS transmembrane domain-containing protein n=2 Tax=Candidatus Wolfeibacteriota TaxID=1752735 RepID=A0A0G1K7H2_9BACT|nr:MAG: GtrA-like protein [uncultured bacterium]KKR12888.1 MAG: hypothetical protein UT41_C0001G0432 [Candidatus Wolfebacteria bacterium GW2011_GWC2_39_22]KKT43819.1 MAG: hypothetical protein UW32_C0001G0411 [Candidatus Wolfebacteria bacterium GW2011_GWE2_44_13]HBI25452.1 hypothetical protein [Candidatus Wolfebacteria bacterium]
MIKKDYILISIIGFLFGILLYPILKNIQLPFLQLNAFTMTLIVLFFVVFSNIALAIAFLIGKKIPFVIQFSKFAAVGAVNSVLDWGILNVLITLSGVAAGPLYALFKAASFIIANINSYFWNKLWVFPGKAKMTFHEVMQFFVVSAVGLVLNVATAALVVNGIAERVDGFSPKQWANIGAASATIISLAWNFVGYKFIVFKEKTIS